MEMRVSLILFSPPTWCHFTVDRSVIEFACGRRFNLPEGRQKILHRDLQLFGSGENRIEMVFPFQGQVSPQGHHARLFAQGFQIGADKGMGDLGKTVEIDIGARGMRRL